MLEKNTGTLETQDGQNIWKTGQYLDEKQIKDLGEVDELREHITESIKKAYHNSCRVTIRKTKR